MGILVFWFTNCINTLFFCFLKNIFSSIAFDNGELGHYLLDILPHDLRRILLICLTCFYHFKFTNAIYSYFSYKKYRHLGHLLCSKICQSVLLFLKMFLCFWLFSEAIASHLLTMIILCFVSIYYCYFVFDLSFWTERNTQYNAD